MFCQERFVPEHYDSSCPLVVLYRIHVCHDEVSIINNDSHSGTTLSSRHDIYQLIHKERFYAVTKYATDTVKSGYNGAIDVVGLVDDAAMEELGGFDLGLVSAPHFFITWRGPDICIQDRASRYGTYLNGRRLSALKKHVLVDGDTISIGISHLHPLCDLGNNKIFVFKIMVRPTIYSLREIQLHNDQLQLVHYNPIEAVLRNVVVVPKIISYLEMPDLKHFRLINNIWNDEISKMMTKHCLVRLCPPTRMCLPSDINFEKWKDELVLKKRLCTILQLESFVVDFLGCTAYPFMSDVQLFVSCFTDQLKFFELYMDISESRDVANFENIFGILVSLEQLELALLISMEHFASSTFIGFPFPMWSVRRLKLTCIQDVLVEEIAWLRPFVLDLIGLFPNLDILELRSLDFYNALNGNQDEMFRHFSSLRNLKVLVLEGFHNERKDIRLLRRLSTNITVGLEQITIKRFRISVEFFNALRQFFETFSHSLQSLSLYALCVEGQNNALDLTVPRFPNLRQLKISVDVWDYTRITPMNWIFSGGVVDYRNDFPVLQELSIYCPIPVYSTTARTLVDAFVPSMNDIRNGSKCWTMKKIIIKTGLRFTFGLNRVWGTRLLDRVAEAFPCAYKVPNSLADLVLPD